MESNELRIGNYINYEQTTHIVKGIDENGNIKSYWIKNKTDMYVHNIFECEPIPLTEEWLLKFGFKYLEVEGYPIYLLGKIMIEFYTEECVFCFDNVEIKTIKFVHSLQNLYFSITEKELLCANT